MEITQLVTPLMVNDLLEIMKMSSDNHEKGDMFEEYLKEYKFKEIGTGTNIAVFVHKDFPKHIFKFALDSNGFNDNVIDAEYALEIPEYNICYDVHKTGLYSIQKKAITFKGPLEISPYIKDILKILKRLEKTHLLVDMSPINYKNYGIDPDTKKLVIIDGSDMIRLDEGKLSNRCQRYVATKKKKIKGIGKYEESNYGRCGGDYVYDDEYHKLICLSCGAVINPLELRKTMKEVNLLKGKEKTIGLDNDMLSQIDELIKNRRKQNPESQVMTMVTGSSNSEEQVENRVNHLYSDDMLDIDEPEDQEEDEDDFGDITSKYQDQEDLLDEEQDEDDDKDDEDDEQDAQNVQNIKDLLSKKSSDKEENESIELIDELKEMDQSDRDIMLSKLGYVYIGDNAVVASNPICEIFEESTSISLNIVDANGEIPQHVCVMLDDDPETPSPTLSEILFRFEKGELVYEFNLGEILNKLKYKTWEI